MYRTTTTIRLPTLNVIYSTVSMFIRRIVHINRVHWLSIHLPRDPAMPTRQGFTFARNSIEFPMFSCENNFFFPLDPHVSFANLRGPWIPKTGIKHSYTSRGREAKENGKLVFYVLPLASTASNMAKKERRKKSDSDVDFLPLLVCYGTP